MNKLLLIALIAIIGLLLSGCPPIVGTPLLIEYRVDDFASSDESIGEAHVDLEENDDYLEHRDEITGVDHVFIGAVIINHSGHAVSGELWYSDDALSGATEIREYADLLYTSEEIPDGDTLRISFQPDIVSIGLDASLINGSFYVYGLGDQSDFDVEVNADLQVLFYINPMEGD